MKNTLIIPYPIPVRRYSHFGWSRSRFSKISGLKFKSQLIWDHYRILYIYILKYKPWTSLNHHFTVKDWDLAEPTQRTSSLEVPASAWRPVAPGTTFPSAAVQTCHSVDSVGVPLRIRGVLLQPHISNCCASIPWGFWSCSLIIAFSDWLNRVNTDDQLMVDWC